MVTTYFANERRWRFLVYGCAVAISLCEYYVWYLMTNAVAHNIVCVPPRRGTSALYDGGVPQKHRIALPVMLTILA